MEIDTPVGKMTLPDSVRRLDPNVKTFTRSKTLADGRLTRLDIQVRWDDTCKNGHNSFAITGDLYESQVPGGMLKWSAGGCLHEEVAQYMPELAHAIPFHLFGADGPMHYFANTAFLAGDADCWGTRKGEQRRGKDGLPMWQLPCSPFTVHTAEAAPPDYVVEYEPVLCEGKQRELDAARSLAKLPELTDEELMLPKEALVALLRERAPQLSEVTVANVVYFAGDRDFNGGRAGEQKRDSEGLLVWRLRSSPFTYTHAAEKPQPFRAAYKPVLGEGKERELASARAVACWPEATEAELSLPKAELEKLLAARLPRLMDEFKTVVEGLGFTY